MSRSVAVWPSDAVSIFRVTCGIPRPYAAEGGQAPAMANYFHGGHLALATMPTDQQLLNRRRRSARRLPIGIDALQAEPTRPGCGSEGSTDQRVTSSVPREDLD